MADLYLRDLVPIVELQALELKRLMRDKERLHQKVDSLISEIGSLRQLQQQDQALRAREQDLRAKMQQALADLVSRSGPKKDDSPIRPVVNVTPDVSKQALPGKPADKTNLAIKNAAAEPVKPITQERERMEIPAFLASGPRVGFDQAVADDIRVI
ncbi:MAG: hypothetical protein ACTSWM_06300, partial [Alphaproteobacteria bacterium]